MHRYTFASNLRTACASTAICIDLGKIDKLRESQGFSVIARIQRLHCTIQLIDMHIALHSLAHVILNSSLSSFTRMFIMRP